MLGFRSLALMISEMVEQRDNIEYSRDHVPPDDDVNI